LAGLNYIDSAGAGMLIACNGQMEQNQGRMRIAGARGVVATAFETIHIERVVPLDPDVDTASRQLG
jgi:anti-anti-sigma factor